MNINIKRELLLPALQRTNNVIEKRQTIPILGNILFSCDAQQVSITGTDTEVEVVSFLNHSVNEKLSIAIPGRKLFDICRELPEGADLKLTLNSEKVVIKSGRSRFTLAVSSADEFPRIGEFEVKKEIKILCNELKLLIDKTEFAMANQDVRSYLNGLLLEFVDNQLRSVATDGHRLAIAEREKNNNERTNYRCIIPRKGVMEINRLISSGGPNSEVELFLGENHLKIKIKDASLTTKLLEGTFPDYRKVIPEEGKTPVLVKKEDLRGGVSRAAVLSSERNPLIRMSFVKNQVILIGNNQEQEEAIEEVEVEYSGAEMEVGFNVTYLLDILAVIESDKVRIDLQSPDSSCLISSPDEPDSQFVVMPMRI